MKPLFQLALVVSLWLLWKHTASPAVCMAFWIAVLLYGVRPLIGRRSNLGIALVLVGVLSNAMVTTANSGVMPANMPTTFVPASPIWQPAAHHKLLWMSDQRSLYYFSIGDLCLLIGCGLSLFLRRRRAVMEAITPKRVVLNRHNRFLYSAHSVALPDAFHFWAETRQGESSRDTTWGIDTSEGYARFIQVGS